MIAREQALRLFLYSSIVILAQSRSYFLRTSGSFLRKRLNAFESTGELLTSSVARTCRSKCSSDQGSEECEFEVENNTDEPLLLCWISSEGKLLGFRKINDRSIKDNSVSNKHIEYTFTDHSFICMKHCEKPPGRLCDVPEDIFVFHYTPKTGDLRHRITVEPRNKRSVLLRFSKGYDISVSTVSLDNEVIDSSNKAYESVFIAGFEVKCEPGVFTDVPDLAETIILDITTLAKLLPTVACSKLQASTPIWLNKSLVYGPKHAPINELNVMFHPLDGAPWLKKHGLSVAKAGGVEICNAADYLRARDFWGPGGVLVHEFSHAYHNKFCSDGYECPDIIEVDSTIPSLPARDMLT
jgi:hypothetical protein